MVVTIILAFTHDYTSQTSVEIYGKTNGMACYTLALAHA